MTLEIMAGGMIFAGVVAVFVIYLRNKKADTSGDGTPGPGKDRPPRTDGPRFK